MDGRSLGIGRSLGEGPLGMGIAGHKGVGVLGRGAVWRGRLAAQGWVWGCRWEGSAGLAVKAAQLNCFE